MGVLNQQNNMMDMIPRKNANESYRQQTNKTPKKSWSAYFHTAFSIACLLGYAFVVTAAPFVPSDQELDPNCAPGDVDCYVDISSGGITSLGGLTGATQTFAVGSSGTDFAVSSSGTTHTFNIPTASATNRGLLSTSDWTTFNAKESALTFSSPLSRSVNTISIDNAAADGSTKGAATFTASDFDASSGLISIDYTNGQAASNSTKGFLTSADWTTFNAKQDALTVQNGLTLTGTTLKLGGTMTEDTGILYDPAVNYIAFGDANSGLFAFGNLEDPLDPPIISFLVNGVNAVTINSTGGFDVSADSDITLTSATDVDLVGAGMNLTSDTSIIGNAQNIALNGDVDIMLSSISGTSTSTVYTSLNGWASTSAKVLEETVAETGYYAAINDPVTGEGFSNIYWGILDGSNVITDISRISVGLDDTSTAFAEIHVVIDPTGVVSNFNGFDALPSRTQMAYNADDTMGATGLVWGIDSGGWTANNALNDLFTINTSGQIASTINTSGYTASFTNDGNNTNRSGLLVQAGLYDQSSAGPSTLIQFNDGDGTAVGSITFGSSATAYNTSSDRRLKENIEDTSLSIDTLREIQIRDFTWKADSTHALAHG